MQQARLRFFLALALFMGWVVGLGAMALLSADRPRPRIANPAVR